MDRTLLVTDDALIIREMIKDAAIADGWTIVGEGRNGQEAIDLFRQFRPGVTTLDLVMPGYGGLHALRGIRDIDPDAKVIVISAIGQKPVLQEAFKAGATDFLIKPFDKRDLLATLAQTAIN